MWTCEDLTATAETGTLPFTAQSWFDSCLILHTSQHSFWGFFFWFGFIFFHPGSSPGGRTEAYFFPLFFALLDLTFI